MAASDEYIDPMFRKWLETPANTLRKFADVMKEVRAVIKDNSKESDSIFDVIISYAAGEIIARDRADSYFIWQLKIFLVYVWYFSLARGTTEQRRKAALEMLLLTGARVQYGDGGYAIWFMHHFLEGTGRPAMVSLRDLLAEDVGVERHFLSHVRSELFFPFAWEPIPVRVPQTSLSYFKVDQSFYANPDWHGALGSFELYSLLLNPGDPPEAQIVWAAGDKGSIAGAQSRGHGLWTWHPDQLRVSQLAHVAGDLLENAFRSAKSFEVYASECFIHVKSGKSFGSIVEAQLASEGAAATGKTHLPVDTYPDHIPLFRTVDQCRLLNVKVLSRPKERMER